MPGYKTHLAGGLIVSGLVGILASRSFPIMEIKLNELWFILPIILLFSVLSDIDIRTSKIFLLWSIIAMGGMLIFVLRILFKGMPSTNVIIAMAGLAILYLLSLFARHRGFFHKYSTGIIFTLPVWMYFGVPAGIAALSAYWSHLILDKVRPDT